MSEQDALDPDITARRHVAPVPDDEPALGDLATRQAVARHVERTIGPVASVFHEILSAYVRIDVHHVAPTPERPFHVLVTSGMSSRPMTTPAALPADLRHAELLVCLPADWPVSDVTFEDERHYWPVRWLKQMARFPHEHGTWIGHAHTVPNGDPPAPLGATTGLAGFMILPPALLGDAVHRLTTDSGDVVRFWSLLPLYPEEIALKLRNGADALIERLDAAGVTDLVNPDRPNVAARWAWWPL